LTFSIEDNGKGFEYPPLPPPAGNSAPNRSGLTNLQQRLQEIGGQAECRSAPGKGAVIKLRVPLQPEKPAEP